MEQKEYSVSEAVRLIGVESHVLRYWEEELQVKIRRTELGYRVYSEENAALFRRVKELREQGISLKAIRQFLLADKVEESGSEETTGHEIKNIRKSDEERKTGEGVQLIRMMLESPESERTDLCTETELDGDGELRRTDTQANTEFTEETDARANTEFTGETDVRAKEEFTWETGSKKELDPAHDHWSEGDAETSYELVSKESAENLQQFEQILKQLIAEVMEEQNQKLEKELVEAIRSEAEELYLFWQTAQQQAAAASELGHGGKDSRKKRIMDRIFGRKRKGR